MKFLKNRVLPFVCTLSILVSFLVVPAFAADFPAEFADHDSVDYWNAKISTSPNQGLNAICQTLGLGSANEVFWALVNGQVSSKAGEVNRSELEILASTYTAFFNSTIGETFGSQIKNSFGDVFNDFLSRALINEWDPYFEVVQHPSSGLYRIKEMTTGLFVVDSAGRYPYAEASSDGFLGTDQWVPISAMDGGSFRMLSKEAIYNLADDVGGTAYTRGNYICIAKNASSGVVDKMVLANEDGKPYVCWKDKNQSATEQERPTTNVTENGNIVEGDDNSVNLDLEGMTMLLPGGTLAFIDQIIYDESTKSYHIDSHDTYNYTVNNYYTWNYYINYTSITYIGQTEEYNKYYEVYYELPDGRSSADLTKEDLEQLNLSVDVIPYGRSADDTSLRSLYHFDGDTKDSSYWNYCTDFKWNKGASLTYMDAGVFNGALYLDETEHDFSLILPNNISMGDFTLQFRYYQSATPAPVTDSYLNIGGSPVLQFDGANLKTHDGTVIAQMPVGSWNEIAVVRKEKAFKIYLNGVLCSTSNYLYMTALNWDINFHFGSEQQTFKYLDELRFLNYALTTSANYTPTSVPYDTNLTLVLPDTATPVADEYWDFDQTIAPVWSKDFTTGYSDSFAHSGFTNLQQIFSEFKNRMLYVGRYTTITETQGFTSVLTNSSSMFKQGQDGGGLVLPISGGDSRIPEYWDFTGAKYRNNSSGVVGPYTFSVVTRDGETYSLTFNMFYPVAMEDGIRASASFDWGNIYYVEASNSSPKWTYIWVLPKAGVTLDFVYMELVNGSTPNTGHEFVQSVTGIDKDDLNTPTLAVRTDIDITSYQIGGVRPSLPKKGMVWAMVENERITSIQIYNGQAWEGVDGRIWTGERWIPASSYNIITLQDLYDIVDATPNYEYIYSEAGFWAWWQKSWNAFQEKLFQALGSGGSGNGCQHTYAIISESDPTCTDPGQRIFKCSLCENQYVESLPALGHDWIQTDEIPTTYIIPDGTACPDCAGMDYAAELDEDAAVYSCTCNTCDTVWTVPAVVIEGKTLYTCSRCSVESTEADKENSGFFDALGNFLADGVEWVTDKLKQLVDALDGLNDIFSDYVTTIREKVGQYPLFLGAALAFMPDDLMAVFWFSVVAFVILAVWKKWLR